MSDTAVYLLLACIVVLAGFSAYRVSRSVQIASQKLGNDWTKVVRTLVFIVCFAVFAVAMLLVFGLFFGR